MSPDPVVESDLKQVVFSYEADEARGVPPYRDALYVPAGTPQAKVSQLVRARYEAYANAILNPPEPEPVAEVDAVTAARAAIVQARAALDGAEAALAASELAPPEE